MEELKRPKALVNDPGSVKLGVFLPNEHANAFMTTGARLTDSTYSNVRSVARLADEIGFAFALTVARWKGCPGDSVGYAMYGFDTFSLAGALLEATKKIAIISTAHSIVWNPVIAAKLGADLDQIGDGRWGMNVVAGWSESEFGSMGISLSSRAQRYDQAVEWLTAVRELWISGESSHTCEFFTLNAAECHPRPLQKGGPLVVNAGQSPTGMRFAIENADYLFSASSNGEQFRKLREELKSNVGFIGYKQAIVGTTDAEAEEKAAEIMKGWDVVAYARRAFLSDPDRRPDQQKSDDELRAMFPTNELELRARMIGDATIGSPEKVANELADWAIAKSVDGICLTFYDFIPSLELMAERGLELLGNRLADAGKRLVLL